MLAKYDPTLPLGAALCFCAWRLFAKRRARSPEGPYWGNSPVWGALATTLAGLLLGGLVPPPPPLPPTHTHIHTPRAFVHLQFSSSNSLALIVAAWTLCKSF